MADGPVQLISLAAAGVAFAALVLNIGFFTRPGVDDVLGGLLHHAFVLGLLLLLTAGSRTVSLSTSPSSGCSASGACSA